MTPSLVRVLRACLDHRGTKETTAHFLTALQGHRAESILAKDDEVYTEAMIAYLQNFQPPRYREGPPWEGPPMA